MRPLRRCRPSSSGVGTLGAEDSSLDTRELERPQQIREHRAHALQWLPIALLLACPLLHLFHGHGGHGHAHPLYVEHLVDALLAAAAVPEAARGDLLAAYHRRLINPDPAVHLPAARAWSTYEGVCSTLLPSPETVAYFAGDGVALGLARIEAHYFSHDIFLPQNALLQSLHRLRRIPCVIVQGRYDAVCPIVTADEVHRAWPEAEYIIVPDAGHSAWEPGISAQLVRATERFKTRR